MEIGISTASIFNRCMVENTPPIIRMLGADVAEIFLNTYSEYEESLVGKLRDSCLENDIRVYSVHPMSMQFEPQLFSVHARQREDALAIYRKVLQACRILGATHYVMHGVAILSQGAQNLKIERLSPRFSELCALAADNGITLCLENVSWCIFHEPSFAVELTQAMGSHALKFCLDIKQSVRAGVEPLSFINMLGSDIQNVHICDYLKTDDGYRWKLPGQGACDLPGIARALRDTGYDRCAFVEVYNNMYPDYSVLKDAYQYTKSIFCKEE